MGARVTTAKAAVVLLVCVGLGVARPFAAQDSAALSGTVTDGQGGVLPGATVTVSGQRSPEVKVVTDEHGVFHVLALEPGTYQVRIELAGFRTEQTTVTARYWMAPTLLWLSPTDGVTFLIAATLLASVALLASALPALRASRVDPMLALRQD